MSFFYTTFPSRVWEQTPAGLWTSREATPIDRERRRTTEDSMRQHNSYGRQAEVTNHAE